MIGDAEMMNALGPKEEPFVNCHSGDEKYYVFDQRTRRAPVDANGHLRFFVDIDTVRCFGIAVIKSEDGKPTFGRERINGDFTRLWMGKRETCA
jgi:hypothetical protein